MDSDLIERTQIIMNMYSNFMCKTPKVVVPIQLTPLSIYSILITCPSIISKPMRCALTQYHAYVE